MTKEQFINGFRSAAPYLGAAVVQAPFILEDADAVSIGIALSCISLSGLKFYLECKKFEYTNTPEYREYVQLYDEVVTDIAKMYKELGFKGDYITSIAFQHCLDTGVFSKDVIGYTLYEDDKDRLVRYAGGRVATGAYCCRHCASLLSDVLTKMGGIAPKIAVYSGPEDDEKKIWRSNHLVTGVLHNDKRLIVNPVAGLAGFFINGVYLFDNEYEGKKRTAISLIDNRYYLLYSDFSLQRENMKAMRKFMRYDSNIEYGEIHEAFAEGLLEAFKYDREFRNFRNDERPKILQLAKLSEVVAPHGKVIVEDE